MTPETAICLINKMVLKPGWSVEVTDHSDRFENTIKVDVTYPCFNTNREEAPAYANSMTSGAAFPIPVGDIDDVVELSRRLLMHFASIEMHEWREALRVGETKWAPFHPHHIDGINRWGDPTGDYLFGLA